MLRLLLRICIDGIDMPGKKLLFIFGAGRSEGSNHYATREKGIMPVSPHEREDEYYAKLEYENKRKIKEEEYKKQLGKRSEFKNSIT